MEPRVTPGCNKEHIVHDEYLLKEQQPEELFVHFINLVCGKRIIFDVVD